MEIVKIASEVTERVTQAQEHRSLLAALNRSMAMISFTPQGTIVSANDNMLALMGYRLEEVWAVACGAVPAGVRRFRRLSAALAAPGARRVHHRAF